MLSTLGLESLIGIVINNRRIIDTYTAQKRVVEKIKSWSQSLQDNSERVGGLCLSFASSFLIELIGIQLIDSLEIEVLRFLDRI